ncbi:hypothetical protein QN277_002505 [Acacia crassicarpa]|uniref:Uncharacterized protein n=1 Tax=Acacia crassicarpa TaxID=499986 RepID=A0AAE1N9H0_9FABA|nr:hypothetical protein QN277_002505 [Acacia crassicarpa]
MTGEEVAGPPGPKVLRLLCFVGAGVICVVTINKMRNMERRTLMQQQMKGMSDNSSEAIAAGKAGE